MAQVIDVQVPPTMVAKVIAVSCCGADGGNNSGQRRHSTVTNQIKIIDMQKDTPFFQFTHL